MPPFRRLARNLYLACSVIALLLALVVAVAWIRGQWASDRWTWRDTNETRFTLTTWMVVNWRSGIYMERREAILDRSREVLEYFQRVGPVTGMRHGVFAPRSNPYSGGTFWNRLGLHFVREPPTSAVAAVVYESNVHVPYWFLLLVLITFASPALLALHRRRRAARRVRSNCCPACGYDLRGSTPGGQGEQGALPRMRDI